MNRGQPPVPPRHRGDLVRHAAGGQWRALNATGFCSSATAERRVGGVRKLLVACPGDLAGLRDRALLPAVLEGASLEHFLPEPANDGSGQALRRGAALVSTLLAGLELSRDGGASLAQEKPFRPTLLVPAKESAG